MLRLAFVDGATPAKWARIWAQRQPDLPLELTRVTQREQLDALRSGTADIAIIRLPVQDAGLSVIPLYSEVAVAVAPKDHAIGAADELTIADIADEPRVVTDELTDAQVMELVAAGLGIVIVPHSIARLHARKDTISRPVTDAPETRIALVWPADATTPEVEEFVGIVRGRTANSSRGASADAEAPAGGTGRGSKQGTGTKGGTKSGTSGRPAARSSRGKGASARNTPPSRGRRRRG